MTLAAPYRQGRGGPIVSRRMPLELDPAQPEPVTAAIERLLADGVSGVDPWWAAGLAESLRGGDGAPAEDPRGGAGVVES
jgi:hypothetical protein